MFHTVDKFVVENIFEQDLDFYPNTRHRWRAMRKRDDRVQCIYRGSKRLKYSDDGRLVFQLDLTPSMHRQLQADDDAVEPQNRKTLKLKIKFLKDIYNKRCANIRLCRSHCGLLWRQYRMFPYLGSGVGRI
jgi:hypothetical protein